MEVFVYGTLTDADRTRAVLGERFEYGPPATLVGLRRVEARYPTLAPPGDPGECDSIHEPRVEGRILRTPLIDALDDYERVDRGLYVRVTVPAVREGSGDTGDPTGDGDPDGVEVYVGNPDRLDADGVEWPGTGGFRDRVRGCVEDAGVRVRIVGEYG